MSYTEKEFDYAIEKGIKVIVFLHEHPEELPAKFYETDNEKRKKLEAFREKASAKRVVKFWKHKKDLIGLVILSLQQTIKKYQAIGWIRANMITNPEVYKENSELQKKMMQLQEKNDELIKEKEFIEKKTMGELANLDTTFEIHGEKFTWREIFGRIAPHLLSPCSDLKIALNIEGWLGIELASRIDDFNLQTIKIQLLALGLIKIGNVTLVKGGVTVVWELTDLGHKLMLEIRSIKQESGK